MGEIAEDMVDGFMCSLCGTYFEKEHDYPVVCDYCWDDLSVEEKKHYQKHIYKKLG